MDRQGRGRRKHLQQAGGASGAILTSAVKPWSEKGNQRFPAGFPLPQGILHGGAASSAAMGIQTPFPPACSWRFTPPGRGWRERVLWGPWKADTENRDGCHCTRRTPATPPAPIGAGFIVAGAFPLGGRAAFWRSPACPAGKSK
ncbi:hypothetical protein NDU88_004909 [Pleurodeles waltl]|uniref:Uncharacterized protein n=1 Tax=Pleurodeles waltl TaxID=8319 RepID=A0AAV7VHK2_PLEWA|nr:hypothetical protein NDU88_004909 [Pleurodeles waltl]